MEIVINSYIPMTNVEGPNTRFCIWVQGCTLRCKGCANSHMWDIAGGTRYDTAEIISMIMSYKDKIEGITFLGGEPLEQIEAVTEIAKAVQKEGLSVLVFTGYEYKAIKNNKAFQELKKYVDILIDGRFDENKIDYSRAWVGSSNQHYYFFTDRYDDSVIRNYKNKIELRIDNSERVIVNGMGDFNKIKNLVR